MVEEIITLADLSEKLGLNKHTLSIYLCRFGKYIVQEDNEWQYKYKYNYYFLLELKKFFQKKRYDHNGKYFSKFQKVLNNINILIKEM